MTQVTIQVIGMACENCVNSIKEAVKESGASAQVNLKTGSVQIHYDEKKISIDFIKDAIEDLGYDIVN